LQHFFANSFIYEHYSFFLEYIYVLYPIFFNSLWLIFNLILSTLLVFLSNHSLSLICSVHFLVRPYKNTFVNGRTSKLKILFFRKRSGHCKSNSGIQESVQAHTSLHLSCEKHVVRKITFVLSSAISTLPNKSISTCGPKIAPKMRPAR
jgi:hypothetical protein